MQILMIVGCALFLEVSTITYTVGDISSWTLDQFWCKMTFFKRVWHKVEVQISIGSDSYLQIEISIGSLIRE